MDNLPRLAYQVSYVLLNGPHAGFPLTSLTIAYTLGEAIENAKACLGDDIKVLAVACKGVCP